MGYGETLKRSIDALKLDPRAMGALAKSPDGIGHGFLTLALAGVAMSIGMLNPLMIPVTIIFLIVGFIIGWAILHGLAKLFGGKASAAEFFRVLSNVSILYWVMVIPIVGPLLSWLIGLWLLVVEVVAIKNVHKLSTGKSVLVVAIPVVVGIILATILMVAGLAYWGMMNNPGAFHLQ